MLSMNITHILQVFYLCPENLQCGYNGESCVLNGSLCNYVLAQNSTLFRNNVQCGCNIETMENLSLFFILRQLMTNFSYIKELSVLLANLPFQCFHGCVYFTLRSTILKSSWTFTSFMHTCYGMGNL